MSTTRRLWVPLLFAFVVAGLLGPGIAAGAEPRTTWAQVTIPAAALIPTSDNYNYWNGGNYLQSFDETGSFTAQIPFAAPASRVYIRRITLYAYDYSDLGQVCATLYRPSPAAAGTTLLGQVCTGDSIADPQTASTTAISPRGVHPMQGVYLWVGSTAPGLNFYGVTITYSY